MSYETTQYASKSERKTKLISWQYMNESAKNDKGG